MIGVLTYAVRYRAGCKSGSSRRFRSLRGQHVLPELRRGLDLKVKAYWFHVRERGVFGAIFGTLISFGVYFAFDWGQAIVT